MQSSGPSIVWFRQDLRVADNPALTAAVESGAPVLPIFILDDDNSGEWQSGSASRWWLHHSLASLDKSLHGSLRFFRGKADDIIADLADSLNAGSVYWNRCYEPWRVQRDRKVSGILRAGNCAVHHFNGSLLFEPQSVTKKDGTPYRVFTPFYKNGCRAEDFVSRPLLPAVTRFQTYPGKPGVALDKLNLLPERNWYTGMQATWTPGESGAAERLRKFLHGGVQDYAQGRNRPDLEHVSRLSPHLHFGELSPQQAWSSVRALPQDGNTEHFLSELGWREFSHYLLYHWPDMPRRALQRRFEQFPWRDDPRELKCWQTGKTGIPIVDAGMRQLWQTGYMHNRVRMVVGSFLVKNLLIHWHHGEDWFWDTLVDADLANNSAGWQWIAGCGADAAPYFRVFNPVTQGKRFDPDGEYVRKYLPELAKLPTSFVHNPWEAPHNVLDDSGIQLGVTYPKPIVDLKQSRQRALEAFGVTGTGD